jgi:hypothetical protein
MTTISYCTLNESSKSCNTNKIVRCIVLNTGTLNFEKCSLRYVQYVPVIDGVGVIIRIR